MGINSNKGYQIIERIGRGGCGIVYLVQKENKNYALKKITDLNNNEIDNYQKLLKTLYKIKSEYVIKYYESYVEKDCLYIIMEYGGNTDLKKYIKKQGNNLIEEKTIKNIIIQICLGLKEIHKNKLIHRDLTPDNIFMDGNNNIKIGDFSVSKILTTNKYTKSKVGKYHYFAPEIEKEKEYNNKADIYALGCIIYELFTLNEYYDVKNNDDNINTKIYNPKWQYLIDLTLQEDYNKRPNIDEIYNYIENEISNNEIICSYYKEDKNEINILHDYKSDAYQKYCEKSYNEAKNNINEESIEIYVNNKKIKFNYIYESDEIGTIKIKFKFKKLLTSTAFMFSHCSSLESIDFSSFNTNSDINMSHMFDSCSSLETLDLSSLNTSNVTDMSRMFIFCENLKTVNLPRFSNNVTNISGMFRHCTSLESLDISLFNTNNVTDMSNMFYNCSSLKSLDLSSFNTNKVINMRGMFCGCISLKSINLSSFNTNNVVDMSWMFGDCKNLKSINISSFNTNNVVNVSDMFFNCLNLKIENIKINKKEKDIINEFKNIKININNN